MIGFVCCCALTASGRARNNANEGTRVRGKSRTHRVAMVPSRMKARAATYVDRILRGEKPGDLPVQLPTKFEMVVNRRTATALGLAVPPSIMLRATEVIE